MKPVGNAGFVDKEEMGNFSIELRLDNASVIVYSESVAALQNLS